MVNYYAPESSFFPPEWDEPEEFITEDEMADARLEPENERQEAEAYYDEREA